MSPSATSVYRFTEFSALAGATSTSVAEPEAWKTRIARTGIGRVTAAVTPLALTAAIAAPAFGAQAPIATPKHTTETYAHVFDWPASADLDVWVPQSSAVTRSEIEELNRIFAIAAPAGEDFVVEDD